MSHFGIDLSNYQGDLTGQELAAMKAAGVEYAFVLATQGQDFQNPDAVQQVKALRTAGIHVGFYHFVVPADNWLSQLGNFQRMAAALGGSNLPAALDVETPDPGGWQALAVLVMNLATNIENWTYPVPHPRTLLYANTSYYKSMPGFPWGRWVWLADPNPGAPHEPCLILQGAPRATAGFASVDPDTFLGSETQWAAFLGLEAPVGPSPAPVPIPPTQSSQEDDMAFLVSAKNAASGPKGVVEAGQVFLVLGTGKVYIADPKDLQVFEFIKMQPIALSGELVAAIPNA